MNITRNYSFRGSSIIIGLLLVVSVTSLSDLSFAQQENQQQNQTGGGNQTGGQQQNQPGIGTAQELENLTGVSNETIASNTDIESPNATTMGGLEQEQTSTETTNMSSQQQNQSQQQQNQTGGNQTGGGQGGQNQTQQGPLEQLGEALGGIFGGGSQ
ncbi:MAG: hypothetical protein M3297_15910 [Thermoproteota archaeon]|nr:hypothetical protein [Thermoproteota archaeon]